VSATNALRRVVGKQEVTAFSSRLCKISNALIDREQSARLRLNRV